MIEPGFTAIFQAELGRRSPHRRRHRGGDEHVLDVVYFEVPTSSGPVGDEAASGKVGLVDPDEAPPWPSRKGRGRAGRARHPGRGIKPGQLTDTYPQARGRRRDVTTRSTSWRRKERR